MTPYQMVSPARIITVSLDMGNAFDTINIHTLFRKLLQSRNPGTIMRSSQTTSTDAKPTQHIETPHPYRVSFKTGVPQGGAHSPSLFNIYTAHLPPPIALVQGHVLCR